ncbi:hypothetical protein C2S51_030297 [Perilla frutescens var. frutescens]|nr:hypothetical protein C2S51_030297 [Perilla frutescens var. frutescens]
MEHNNRYLHLLLLLSVVTLHFLAFRSNAATNLSAIYAFGDSVFDAGNNNKLPTLCLANHEPYGINFPGKIPSGRFTNGKLPADMLIKDLGIKDFLPAYLDPAVTASDILTGVTFASSCSGLDDLTAGMVGVLSMEAQFSNFEKAFKEMEGKFGLQKAGQAVQNALFLVSGGANDMMDNYYALPLRRIYSVSVYHDILLSNLHTFIQKLTNRGAKRLAVIGMPPLGCLPVDVTIESFNSSDKLNKRRCKRQHNLEAQSYNSKLRAFVTKMLVEMPGIKIAYMDIYNPMMQMIRNPNLFGLNTTLEGCCGTGSLELGPFCTILARTCENPSKYLFWDEAHPTQATYQVLLQKFKYNVLPTLLK